MQGSEPKFFDVHTHVQFAAFEKDYKDAINRALEAGVWLVNVGTQKDTSKRAIEIAHEYKEGVYATIGLHPIHTGKSFHDSEELGGGDAGKTFTSRGESFNYDDYKKLVEDPKVVAIGECGLDYFRIEGDEAEAKRRQKVAFEAQIELAKEVKKPLMIHCRNAFHDLIDVLKPNTYNLKPSIIHFFTGTMEDAQKLFDLGFYFTFGGVITFARDYDEAIKLIPMDRILSETDAPYVSPLSYRGKRNEPAYVVEVVKKLAEIKEVSLEDMAEHINRNARTVFCDLIS